MSKNKNIFKKLLSKFKSNTTLVAVLNLHGAIGCGGIGMRKTSLSIHSIKKDIDQVFALPKLKAVALSVNSPGGSPVQSERIYDYIRCMSKKHKIPVYAFAEDVAASGGYFLACAAKEIYASNNSIIGSIGVITSGFGFTDAIKKIGIERRVVTQGKNKSVMDPFLPIKSQDKKILTAIQKDIHESFKEVVIKSRGNKLKEDHDILFSGEFWSGKQSLKLGLIDGIGDMYAVMNSKYGDNIKYHCIEKKEPWIKKKLGLDLCIYQNIDYFIDKIASSIRERLDSMKFGS